VRLPAIRVLPDARQMVPFAAVEGRVNKRARPHACPSHRPAPRRRAEHESDERPDRSRCRDTGRGIRSFRCLRGRLIGAFLYLGLELIEPLIGLLRGFGTRHILDALNAEGYAIDRLHVAGGHARNPRREDPAFSRVNLETALAAGAAVEVDLVASADGDFVCLHELMLEHETTGRGPVAGSSSQAVLAFQRRDNAGEPLESRILGFAELVQIVRSRPPPGQPDGCVQLDLNEPLAGITPEVCRRFAATLGDLGWFTLSGPSWPAIERLAATVAICPSPRPAASSCST